MSLASINIQRDIGPNGEEVMRYTGWEHLRWTQNLNHKHLVEWRRADVRNHRTAELHTMKFANEKHKEKIEANRDAVFKMLKSADDTNLVGQGECNESYDNLEAYPLDTFDALKAPELKLFIIAHKGELTKLSDIPNRGHVEEVKRDPPVQNRILMAYNCRLKPNLLES